MNIEYNEARGNLYSKWQHNIIYIQWLKTHWMVDLAGDQALLWFGYVSMFNRILELVESLAHHNFLHMHRIYPPSTMLSIYK